MVSRAGYSKKNRQKGFTIVEVLLGIAVFSIIVPVIVLSIITLTQINQNSINLTYANIIASNKIETLRSIGYNSLPLSTVDFSNELPVSFGSSKSATYTTSTQSVGVKDIKITVSYKVLTKTINLYYETYISEIGVGQ